MVVGVFYDSVFDLALKKSKFTKLPLTIQADEGRMRGVGFFVGGLGTQPRPGKFPLRPRRMWARIRGFLGFGD